VLGLRLGPRLAAWSVLGIAVLLLVGWPLGRLLIEGLSSGAGRLTAAIGSAGLLALAASAWTSMAATVLAVGAALAFALLTERTQVAGRALLRACLVLPLLVPDFVSAISWTRAYGPAGLSHRLLGVELPGLYGPFGIVLLLGVSGLPLAYLVVMAGLRVRSEPDLERAARASGAGAFEAFRSITLPLLRPVLAAATGIVFITSMNAFGIPAVLGRPAGFSTMTTRIYQDLAFSASDEAFTRVIGLALTLLVVSAALVALVDRSAASVVRRTGGSAGGPLPGGWSPRLAAVLGWSLVVVGVLLPLVALLLTALTRAVGLPPLPENLTLANFGRALDSHAIEGIRNTLVVSVLAASVAVGLGLLTVVLGRRARRAVETVATVPFALPGSVLAVAVLLAFGAALRDTLALILVAYVAKLWALAQRPTTAALDRVPVDLLRAARASGAGALATARTIGLPLLAPTVAVAWLLVFVFALHEVTISVLLYGPGTATLAVVILNLQQLGDPLVTSALAVLLTAGGFGAVGLLLWLARRGSRIATS
jgi:iron(III) transport system permease protein